MHPVSLGELLNAFEFNALKFDEFVDAEIEEQNRRQGEVTDSKRETIRRFGGPELLDKLVCRVAHRPIDFDSRDS